jgi:hypothetical protein
MLRVALLLLLGCLASSPAFAFYCGTKLIHEGQTRGEVRAKCGEPAEIEVRSILRRPVSWIGGTPVFVGSDFVEIPVEFWTYNFGPNKLMRRLRFEGGDLVEIETLEHGYIPYR